MIGMRWGDAAARAVVLALTWFALTGGEGASWVVGGPAVILATLASGAITPHIRWRWRWMGLVRFVLFFVAQSVRGGVDVARRAFDPRLPLCPGFVRYPMRLPPGAPRVWLADVVSLLPGTLTVSVDREDLIVHALDTSTPITRGLSALEDRVADIFGLSLDLPDVVA